MAKVIKTPRISLIDMLVDELGVLPQMAASPITMAGSGQVTIPLELDLTSDTICPVINFEATLKLTAPGSNPSKVLDNIRSITIEHTAFRDANGQPKVYTLDTTTFEAGAQLAVALMSDPMYPVSKAYDVVNETVTGQASGSEVSTTYHARFAIPFKLPAGHLKIVLNCQEINYNGSLLEFTSRAAYLVAPRRCIDSRGAYLACDSKRIAGLSTFAFDKNAAMFAVVADDRVSGGILDVYDATTNPNGLGQPAQIGEMTLSQVTRMVTYYKTVMNDEHLEMVVDIDKPIPRVNRATQMTLSLFRFEAFY